MAHRDLYLDPAGDDAADGLGRTTAWRSPSFLHAQRLHPGDRVHLVGEGRFDGPLLLDGVRGGPGEGEAIEIEGSGFTGSLPGLRLVGVAHLALRDLRVWGPGVDPATGEPLGPADPGVLAAMRSAGAAVQLDATSGPCPGVLLERVEAAGGDRGVHVLGGITADAGFTGLRILACDARDNVYGGIVSILERTEGDGLPPFLPHEHLVVSGCRAWHNRGDPEADGHSGSGIVLSGCRGALIEHCVAWENGGLNAGRAGGPVGIWSWEASGVTIRRCVSHHNRCGTGTHDGGGFDLDGGVRDGVIEDCLSHDNEGAGYLVCQFQGSSGPITGSTVRRCVSLNDGARNGHGALHLSAGNGTHAIVGFTAEGNTLVTRVHPQTGSAAPAVRFTGDAFERVTIRDNLLVPGLGTPARAGGELPGVTWTRNAEVSSPA